MKSATRDAMFSIIFRIILNFRVSLCRMDVSCLGLCVALSGFFNFCFVDVSFWNLCELFFFHVNLAIVLMCWMQYLIQCILVLVKRRKICKMSHIYETSAYTKFSSTTSPMSTSKCAEKNKTFRIHILKMRKSQKTIFMFPISYDNLFSGWNIFSHISTLPIHFVFF